MPQRLTTEIFIARAVAIHGNTYDYLLVDYTKNNELVKIVCKVHGVFEQWPVNHMKGCGCNECGNERAADKIKSASAPMFVDKAKLVHGDKYDYSKSVYAGNHKKLTVICKEHGEFQVRPANHIMGRTGCPTCARLDSIYTQDEFVQKAVSQHGERYDYSHSVYQGADTKLEIVCNEHGAFLQTPHQHWRGDGCPGCRRTGYDTKKPGTLYVLELGNITKIGITNRDVKKRVQQIKANSGKAFSILTQFDFEDGVIPQLLEARLLKDLSLQYERPSDKYDGRTESFLNVNIEELLSKIRSMSEELTT